MLPFITGSVPALQSAVTPDNYCKRFYRGELEKKDTFKAHPDRRTQIRAKAERYRKNNSVPCLLLILSLLYPKLLSLANRDITRLRIIVSTFEKGFRQNYCPCPLLKKTTSVKNVPHVYF